MTSTEDFYKTDFAGTLFPLKTNYIVICNIGNELSEYIYQRVLDSQHPGYSFLPQQRGWMMGSVTDRTA